MRFLVLFILLVPALSLADEASESEDGRVVEIDFEALDVFAPLYKPGGIFIGERKPTTFPPLFALRREWAREIAASTREVR